MWLIEATQAQNELALENALQVCNELLPNASPIDSLYEAIELLKHEARLIGQINIVRGASAHDFIKTHLCRGPRCAHALEIARIRSLYGRDFWPDLMTATWF